LAGIKARAKACNTYIAPQDAYRSCRDAFVSQTKQAYKPHAQPAPRTLTCNRTATRSLGLPFNGLHPRNPCNYMNYYSFTDPGGTEGLLAPHYELLD